MTVSLPCRAHSGLHAGIVRWAQSMLSEFPISPSDPTHGPRCIAGRRRGAVLREAPPAPPRVRRGDSCVADATLTFIPDDAEAAGAGYSGPPA